jgi:ATP-dependent helicase/nuclease subunit B
MERLVKRADPLADATDLVDAVLGDLGGDPALAALWRPRLLRMVAWVREQIAGDIEAGWVARHPEVKLEGVRHGVRIHGRADRIDVHADGRLRILDYKTGTPPGAAVFQAGMARQLPLLRFLLEESAALGPGEVTELLYLKLSGGRLGGAVKGRGWVRDRAAVLADLDGLIGRWLLGDAAFVPKLHPVFATATRTWDHLARLEEWLGREAAP